jgi:hypothetical protein
MRLKTLKDLEVIEECQKTNCHENACEWHIHKNGKSISYDFRAIEIKDLRQEAIKWIKELDRMNWKKRPIPTIEWIKHFFNIEESELK